jgi:hypothetical protein
MDAQEEHGPHTIQLAKRVQDEMTRWAEQEKKRFFKSRVFLLKPKIEVPPYLESVRTLVKYINDASSNGLTTVVDLLVVSLCTGCVLEDIPVAKLTDKRKIPGSKLFVFNDVNRDLLSPANYDMITELFDLTH